MVHSACGIHPNDTPEEAQAKILACVRERDVADRLASAIGLSPTAFTVQDITWGARRFLQILAADAPVVALFDDIHWAEPTFLELIENVLDAIDDAPVLMLATARHDLLEARPAWGERERAQRLVLKPLGDDAVAQVVSNLLGASGLPGDFVQRVVDAAEGNPLYVEQMLSMLADSGVLRKDNGHWVAGDTEAEIAIPPTIQALLEARLDNLDRAERATAEPASVIGLEFPRPAVQSLAPVQVRDRIDEKLQALARKHFIRPAGGGDGDARYRFDHHLVRDTVYNGLLKRARATMHAEFVKWADDFNAGSDRGREFEEILGYHLEQAYRYLAELGPIDEAGAAIGRDGARRLGSAARRALARGDMHAAVNLFRRASGLLPVTDDQRLEALPELAEALMGLGKFAEARTVLEEARTQAEAKGNTRVAAASRLIATFLRAYSRDKNLPGEDPLTLVEEVVPFLESENLHNELATAWRLAGMAHAVEGRYAKASEAVQQSLEQARLAGNERLAAKAAGFLGSIALYGPTPVTEAIGQCETAIQHGLSDRQVEASLLCMLASLRAMSGEIQVARSLYQRGREMLQDLGEGVCVAASAIHLANVELHEGDLARAERQMRRDVEFLQRMGENYHLSSIAALLGKVLREQGRDDEALSFLKTAEELSSPNDSASQAFWRSMSAPILARRGEGAKAVELAQEAVELLRKSEATLLEADALAELASVFDLVGRAEDARSSAENAVRLYRMKGDVVAAERVSARALQKQ
jgi:tetratricopeptide (TPR) repeat protein